MKKRLLYIAIMLLVGCSTIYAAGQDADALYAGKQYEQALNKYQLLEAQGEVPASVYYDMGNCYYHLEDYARAILCYHKALALDPYMSEARNNLTYLQHRIVDKNQNEMGERKGTMQPEEPTFFQSIHRFIAINNSSNMWARCAVACFALFVLCVILYVIPRVIILKKVGFFGGIVMLICCLVTLVFSAMAASDSRYEPTAIIKGKVMLREAASSQAKEIGSPVTAGTEMKILEERTDPDGNKWSLLHLNSDNEGWASADEFLEFGI